MKKKRKIKSLVMDSLHEHKQKHMSEIPKEKDLDRDTNFVPRTISNILNEVSMIEDLSVKASKLDCYVRLLEEEMKKVDAFKRELPYCMQLLQDGIETLRKERERLREREEVVVTEELIPVLQSDEGGVESSNHHGAGDKTTWKKRVRLWTAPLHFHNGNHTVPFKSRGGAVDLALKEGKNVGKEVSIPVEEIDLSVKEDSDVPNQKKQRRCWSPELHNLFVDALLNLGGPYVATPKQIRERMKVEGLTNDEVKSHLQKYRLHIRKLPNSSSGVVDVPSTMVARPNSPENHLQNGGSTVGVVTNQDNVLKF